MINRESEFDEPVESAYSHTVLELGFENVKPSLRADFKNLEKAHDAIHEFMLLAPKLFPSHVAKEIGWHRRSAFLIYQWEAFHHAHRSLIEALCAYYNVAFILLRVTFELLVKGAFWECLAHREFRENSQVLDGEKAGREIKKWLDDIFKLAPHVEEEFEEASAGIYDKIGPIVEDSNFRLTIKTIIRQLDQWDIFNPVSDPIASIYRGIYGRLSADVHVEPDRTDIGKRLLLEKEIFEQKILPNTLAEYTHCLHEVIDLAIVVELNIMRDLIEKYDEAKTNLRERLDVLEQLGLEYSLTRTKKLLR
jgi:hypothetical protein